MHKSYMVWSLRVSLYGTTVRPTYIYYLGTLG